MSYECVFPGPSTVLNTHVCSSFILDISMFPVSRTSEGALTEPLHIVLSCFHLAVVTMILVPNQESIRAEKAERRF